MRLRTVVPLAATLLLVAPPVRAQDTGAAPTHPTAFSFGLGAQPSIGLWRRVSHGVELGVEVMGQHQAGETILDQEFRTNTIRVQPAIKLYSRGIGPVLPYVYGAVGVTFASTRNELIDTGGDTHVIESHDHGLGGGLGVGLQWFPIERVSIGGHAGVQGDWFRSRSEFDDTSDDTRRSSNFGTFSSGVVVQLYI